MTSDLRGRVIAVAGGSGGIGQAVVAALAGVEARPFVLDREPPIGGAGPAYGPDRPPPFVRCDLADPDSAEAAIARVVESAGRLDGLVNAAGLTRDRSLHKMSWEEWRSVIDVNLTGAFLVLKAAAARMREQGSGSIVQVASINGLRGKFGQANYTAAKAGLIALTRTAARELGAKGIRVNAVAPGMVRTAMTRSLPPDVLEEARRQTCLGRLAEPEDLAGPILFLLSDLSRHVTGTVLVVDGGQTA